MSVFREKCIFTIDPATAKDLDDAVSFWEDDDGTYKIGVHISDVAYYLKEGTEIDKNVAKRATSTYLVDKVRKILILLLYIIHLYISLLVSFISFNEENLLLMQ